MFSDTLRLELQPFGITVVDLRTAIVKTNFLTNLRELQKPTLPSGSIYEPAREVVEKALRQEQFDDAGISADQWAKAVVRDLTKKNPPSVIWNGDSAFWIRFATWLVNLLPHGTFGGLLTNSASMTVRFSWTFV